MTLFLDETPMDINIDIMAALTVVCGVILRVGPRCHLKDGKK